MGRTIYHEVVLSALSIGRLNVEVGEVELDLPPVARLRDSHEHSKVIRQILEFPSTQQKGND